MKLSDVRERRSVGVAREVGADHLTGARLQVLLPREIGGEARLVDETDRLSEPQRGEDPLDELRLELIEQHERRTGARVGVAEVRLAHVQRVETPDEDDADRTARSVTRGDALSLDVERIDHRPRRRIAAEEIAVEEAPRARVIDGAVQRANRRQIRVGGRGVARDSAHRLDESVERTGSIGAERAVQRCRRGDRGRARIARELHDVRGEIVAERVPDRLAVRVERSPEPDDERDRGGRHEHGAEQPEGEPRSASTTGRHVAARRGERARHPLDVIEREVARRTGREEECEASDVASVGERRCPLRVVERTPRATTAEGEEDRIAGGDGERVSARLRGSRERVQYQGSRHRRSRYRKRPPFQRVMRMSRSGCVAVAVGGGRVAGPPARRCVVDGGAVSMAAALDAAGGAATAASGVTIFTLTSDGPCTTVNGTKPSFDSVNERGVVRASASSIDTSSGVRPSSAPPSRTSAPGGVDSSVSVKCVARGADAVTDAEALAGSSGRSRTPKKTATATSANDPNITAAIAHGGFFSTRAIAAICDALVSDVSDPWRIDEIVPSVVLPPLDDAPRRFAPTRAGSTARDLRRRCAGSS